MPVRAYARVLVALTASIATATVANADTLHVPSQYATIQAAIDGAQPGDEVVVADGVYTGAGSNTNLDLSGKAITVRSASGDPATCVIDCEGDGCGFHFVSGEGLSSVVEGFTITNGVSWRGGGVYCYASSPTIANCAITDNSTVYNPFPYRGAGIYCENSSPTITNCTISDNFIASSGSGGGVTCYSSNPTISDCTISGNWGGGHGGGVFCSGSSPTIANCTITENSASNLGAGVYCTYASSPTITNCAISGNSLSGGAGICCEYDSSPMISDCTISGNSSDDYGGGIECAWNSNPTITNCTIAGNLAYSGGGVFCWGASPMLANSVLSNNVAWHYGGAFNCGSSSSPTISDCTITGNLAGYNGGGVYCEGNSGPVITNSNLWGDQPQEVYVYSGAPVVSYCDVQGNWAGDGNVDGDPLFVDSDGPDNDPNTWEDNDYRLSAGSPCIDAANNWTVPRDVADLDDDSDTSEFTPFDLDGEGRFFDDPNTPDTGYGFAPIVDMGAYEFGGTGAQPCYGDLDNDRDVDIADLAELLGHYGDTSGAVYDDGDLDLDGDVDLADLAELLGVYGTTCD